MLFCQPCVLLQTAFHIPDIQFGKGFKTHIHTIVGFPERSADVRLAQYETGTRKPKAELTAALAQALDVSPHALDVPDIDSYIGLMHTLFTLEDLYGLTVSGSDGEICLKVDTSKGKDAHELQKMLYAWKEQADKLSSEEISKDKYDEWRYHYPEFDTTQTWAKVPSQELSDALVEAFKDKLTDQCKEDTTLITNHDEEIISEIADFNTLTLVTAAYTLYEKLSTKKPISKREFYKEFGDNFQSFKKIFSEDID